LAFQLPLSFLEFGHVTDGTHTPEELSVGFGVEAVAGFQHPLVSALGEEPQYRVRTGGRRREREIDRRRSGSGQP
jgi:hypothetical protein